MKHKVTMWANQVPDCYGGNTYDKVIPRWHCFAFGDKDSDYQYGPLELDAKCFPPGTKITIEEPTCPQCGELRFPIFPQTGPTYEAKCKCGFDWEAWVIAEFS